MNSAGLHLKAERAGVRGKQRSQFHTVNDPNVSGIRQFPCLPRESGGGDVDARASAMMDEHPEELLDIGRGDVVTGEEALALHGDQSAMSITTLDIDTQVTTTTHHVRVVAPEMWQELRDRVLEPRWAEIEEVVKHCHIPMIHNCPPYRHLIR